MHITTQTPVALLCIAAAAAAQTAWAGDGLLDESSGLSVWSFAFYLALVLGIVVFSVVMRSFFLPKSPDRKRKGSAASQATLPKPEARVKALPAGEGRSANLPARVTSSGRPSVASVKKQVAGHAMGVAALKTWCEGQDPERAMAVIKAWLKAEAAEAKVPKQD